MTPIFRTQSYPVTTLLFHPSEFSQNPTMSPTLLWAFIILHLDESLNWLTASTLAFVIYSQPSSQGNPVNLGHVTTPFNLCSILPHLPQWKPKFLPFSEGIQHEHKQRDMDEAIKHHHYFKGGYNEVAYISLIHGGPQKYSGWQWHHQLCPASLPGEPNARFLSYFMV